MVEGLPLLRSRTSKPLLDVLKDVDHGVLGQGLGRLVLGEQVVDEAKGAHAEQSSSKVPPDGIVLDGSGNSVVDGDASYPSTSLDGSAVCGIISWV